jgi:uncharacterized lipoprotein YmbA
MNCVQKLVLTLGLSGCALLSKSEPFSVRYFSPEASASLPALAPATHASFGLRIGSVSSSAVLGPRIVYRRSLHELGVYDEMRWTERPEDYFRRELSRVLFEERGLTRVVSGPAPLLDVELVAFEEVRGDKPCARMQLVFTLSDDRRGHEEQTLTLEEPLKKGKDEHDHDMEAIVQALSRVLERGVTQVADRVTEGLALLEPPPSRSRPDEVSAAALPQ